ncbi:hypothetical protein BN946_scf184943.g6 [Trametes cinnabarina]|uniref:Uncharacterized protein n=1 Tax=Pycnoporus cinnabarinus TaxID=5643 RepID=A0A060SBT0_PYCCI|nr:hypothetical protein BN946_scf184943.g6 [Trametes cinnabarina]
MPPSQNPSHNATNARPQKRSKVTDETEEHTRSNVEENRLAQRKEPPRLEVDNLSQPNSPTLPTFQSAISPEPPLRQPAPLPTRSFPTISEMQSPLHLYDAADFEGLPTLQDENPHSRMSRQGPAPGRLQKNCLVFTPGTIPIAHIPVYKFFGNTNPDQESGVRMDTAPVLAAVIHGGGQRFVSRSPEKVGEIKTFIQSLRFQATPATLPQPTAAPQGDKGKAPARDLPISEGWQGTSVDDIYAVSAAKSADSMTPPDPLAQAKDIWKEVPRRGGRGGGRGSRGMRGRGGGRGYLGKRR